MKKKYSIPDLTCMRFEIEESVSTSVLDDLPVTGNPDEEDAP